MTGKLTKVAGLKSTHTWYVGVLILGSPSK